MGGQARGTAGRRQRGLALVLVLWVLTLLSLMAAGFLSETRTETLAARYRVDSAEAEALADAGVHWAIWRLLESGQGRRAGRDEAMEPVPLDGRIWRWAYAGGEVRISVRDEAGKIDLNVAQIGVLRRLLRAVGVDPEAADSFAARIADFRDGDDAARVGGAEDPDYQAAGLPYGAKDGRFHSVDELGQVVGIDRALAARLRPHVSVVAGTGGVDPTAATVVALAAVPGVDREQAASYVAAREAAPPDQPPSPPLGVNFARSPRTEFTIVAEARSANGGVFVREALVRLDRFSQGRPFSIVDWRQRMSRLPAPAPDSAAGS